VKFEVRPPNRKHEFNGEEGMQRGNQWRRILLETNEG
jgi:hypothetical protein